MPNESGDPMRMPTDYNVQLEPAANGWMTATILPHGATSRLSHEADLREIADHMRSLGLPDGSVFISQDDPLTWRRFDSFMQIIEADESFSVEEGHRAEISQWLQDHPDCNAEIRTMTGHLLIANADGPVSVDYLHFETSDDLAQFADHWRTFPTKVRFPANLRRQMERSYRNPLIARGYQPATMADIEMARIAYNPDNPHYPQYEAIRKFPSMSSTLSTPQTTAAVGGSKLGCGCKTSVMTRADEPRHEK
jgi:hypothetical protein